MQQMITFCDIFILAQEVLDVNLVALVKRSQNFGKQTGNAKKMAKYYYIRFFHASSAQFMRLPRGERGRVGTP